MSTINLLPWREIRARRQQQGFWIRFGLLLGITLVLVLAADWLIERQRGDQQQRNQRLQQEISLLDSQLGEIRRLKGLRKELLDRMGLIARLQMRRNLPVRLLNQLPALVPNGIYLDSLALQNNRIDLNGKTESYGRVASMMRRIDGSGWLEQSRLSTIFATDMAPLTLSQFAMRFQLTVMAEGELDAARGQS